jgi:hypothetical protein
VVVEVVRGLDKGHLVVVEVPDDRLEGVRERNVVVGGIV